MREHLLAEGVRHRASVRAACVAITGGPFQNGMAYVTRLPTSPRRPRDRFRVHPARPVELRAWVTGGRLDSPPAWGGPGRCHTTLGESMAIQIKGGCA